MKVTIEQSGNIVKQGRQYLLIIQQKNWPKIKHLFNRKIDAEITLQPKLE